MKSCIASDSYEGVFVYYQDEIERDEALEYAKDEIKDWEEKGKRLESVSLSLDNEDVVITAREWSHIRRIRRITGYLSEVTNFNDAKRAELSDRTNNDNQEYNYPSDRERYLNKML
ncbi:MAG: anaerobic ribonucleoside triphosphate reductase [Firmicutes bacterium]|nr:anaerobic ribonucleoside triphosphate reductase [Bacillota bacterium]